MKKIKTTKKASKPKDDRIPDNKEKDEEKSNKVDPLDDENQGFGGWLKSDDGLETMKLFVIANSIVMLTTVAYPHFQTAVNIIYDMFYGPDELLLFNSTEDQIGDDEF